MEVETIHIGGTGIIGALTALIAFFGNRSVKAIDKNLEELNETVMQQALDHERLKTKIAEEYTKDSTVQSSLARIHGRIDDVISLLMKLTGEKHGSHNQ